MTEAHQEQAAGTPEPLDRDTVQEMLVNRQFHSLRRVLAQSDHVQVSDLMGELGEQERAIIFRLLPKGLAVMVFEELEPPEQSELLTALGEERTLELLGALSPDDRAALLDETPAMVARRLLEMLPPRDRRVTVDLLGYDEDTAGRRMTPDFVDLRARMTVAQALERIRRRARSSETIYESYVIDDERHLVGVVSLQSLVLAESDKSVGEVMTAPMLAVTTDTSQEEAANLMQDYNLIAAPVVDREGRLVGIITWDDMSDVLEREVTEDIYRYGAVESTEYQYFHSSAFGAVRRRMPWLFLLILVNTVTGSIIAGQEDLLAEVVILSAFVPLLIGTGGNVGAQSSTVVIRGLATGEIAGRQAVYIVSREVLIGVLLGMALGLLVLGWAYFLGRDVRVSLVVCLSLVGIATLAACVGAALPYVFRKLNVDPAMVSAPFITTVMDIFGVALYFGIAHVVLRM